MIVEDQAAETTEEIVVDQADTSSEETVSNPAWIAQMKGDLKDNEYFNQYSTISDAGKSMLDMREQLDRSVVLLGEEPTEENINEFYTKLGRPEDASKYELEKPELPKGIKDDGTGDEDFKALAFKNGLTNKQASDLYKEFTATGIKTYQAALKAHEKEVEATQSNLKEEWGEDYKAEFELAGRAINSFGDKDDVAALNKAGFGNNPTVLKMFNKIGKAMAEDQFMDGSAFTGELPKSVDGFTLPSYANK